MPSPRREFEYIITLLKVDLQISKACVAVKDTLLSHLQKDSYFSPFITHHFKNKSPPFGIDDNDPDQVTLLKKLFNALDNFEKGIRAIESIDLDRDKYLLDINLIKSLYKSATEMYAGMNVLKGSTVEMQRLVEPYLNSLLPKIDVVWSTINSYSNPLSTVNLSDAIDRLPDTPQTSEQRFENITQLLFSIPEYFDVLENLIKAQDPNTKTPQSKEKIEKQAKKLATKLEKLSRTNSTLKAIPTYLSTIQTLLSQYKSLIKSGSSLSNTVFEEVMVNLDKVRREILPELINNLETIEENMCLRPGALTEPTLEKMEAFYSTISKQIYHVNKAKNLLPKTRKKHKEATASLDKPNFSRNNIILQDPIFQQTRRQNQMDRLCKAEQEGAELDSYKNYREAGGNFFNYLREFTPLVYGWNLANLPTNEKEILKKDYQKIQSFFAARYPEVDKMIVAALTSNNLSSLRVINSDFTSIFNCEKEIMKDIEKVYTQAEFKQQLITATLFQTDNSNPTQPLTHDVLPFTPNIPKLEENKPLTYYQDNNLMISRQIKELALMEDAYVKFYEELNNDEYDIKLLRKLYPIFQPLLMKDPDINKAIIDFLDPKKKSSKPFKDDLLGLLIHLSMYVNSTTDELKTLKNDCITHEKEAFEKEIMHQELIHSTPPIDNLLSNFYELKLSEKIDDYTQKIQTYLKENLSPELAEQLFENHTSNQLPSFKETYQGGSEIIMYKKLLNTINLLTKNLKNLEKSFNPNVSFIEQNRSLISLLMTSLMDLRQAKYQIKSLLVNPELKRIVDDMLSLLEPLENIPIVGQLLQDETVTELEKIDMVALWKYHQKVVEYSLNSKLLQTSTMPKKEKQSKEPSETIQIDYLRELAEGLYKLGNLTIDEEELNKKTDDFVNNFKHISLNQQTLKKLLTVVDELQKQANLMGIKGKQALLDGFKTIQVEFQKELLKASSHAEFHLGLKPGVIGEQLFEISSNFFLAQMERIVSTDEANKKITTSDFILPPANLESVLANQLQEEKKRLSEVTNDASYYETPRREIFGMLPLINSLYQLLETDPLTDSDLKKLNELYHQISPEIKNIEVELPRDLTREELDPARNFFSAFKPNLLELGKEIPGNLQAIKELRRTSDFSSPEQNERFLKNFEKLYPALFQIDKSFKLRKFLRNLQTPDDFSKAADKIISMEPKLQEYVEGLKVGKELKIALCNERIKYFESFLSNSLQENLTEQKSLDVESVHVVPSNKNPALLLLYEELKKLKNEIPVSSTNDFQSEINNKQIELIDNQIKFLESDEAQKETQDSYTKIMTGLKQELSNYKLISNSYNMLNTLEKSFVKTSKIQESLLTLVINKHKKNSSFSQFLVKAYGLMVSANVEKYDHIQSLKTILKDPAKTPTQRFENIIKYDTKHQCSKSFEKNGAVFNRISKRFFPSIASLLKQKPNNDLINSYKKTLQSMKSSQPSAEPTLDNTTRPDNP